VRQPLLRTAEEGEGIMKKFVSRLWKDEEGATMVEYALMLALIAAVCVGIVYTLGQTSEATFTKVEGAMTTTNGGTPAPTP
jgi:pilus assembly protein Flp/PilA